MNINQREAGKQQKGRALLVVLVVILVVVAVVGGFYFYKNFFSGAPVSETNKACTAEAKICPDGSSVGRGGPNCEFAPCPTPVATSTLQIPTDWKTYSNEKYGFEFKYSSSLFLTESYSGQNNKYFIISLNTYNAQVNSLGDHGGISPFFQVDISNIDKYASGKCESGWKSEGKIIIGDKSADICSFINEASGKELLYRFAYNGSLFSFYLLEQNLNSLKNILSTFKFTK